MAEAAEISGVLYLSMGADFADLTLQSVTFLRETGYAGPVRVVADTDGTAYRGLDVEVIRVAAARSRWEARDYKTRLNRFGFPITLYIDSDALPIAPIEPVWEALRWGEICLAHDIEATVGAFLDASWEKTHLVREELEAMNEPFRRSFAYFNSGVMLWRRTPRVDQLFDAWREEWSRFRNLDQMALSRAMARTGVTVSVLPGAWNCPANTYPSIGEAQAAGVRILHFLSRQRPLLPAYINQHRREAAAAAARRLRVLWITGSFHPRIGGLELFIKETVESLSAVCDVGLAVRHGQWYPGDKPIAQFTLRPSKAANQTEAWRRMAADLQDILRQFSPDIVHFGSARSAACRAVIPEGMVTVATVHGNDLTDLRPIDGEEDPTDYVVECLQRCDHVFVVSSHTESLVRRWGVATPVSVLTPGCNIEFFRPDAALGERTRRAWGTPARAKVILTVSRLAPRKGHLNVLEAIEQLPFPACWVVAGTGPCAEDLAAAVRERGLADRVLMVGGVTDDELLGLYNACDVFVLTPEERRRDGWLDSEGFGLVLHEAGACAKPVIASALAGCQDAVIDGGTGLLVPFGDPARLAVALERILTDEALARRLGEAGVALVRMSGGWTRLARQTLEIYEDLLGQDRTIGERQRSLEVEARPARL